MSLKTLHIVFITLSTLLSIGFGVWAFRQSALAVGSANWMIIGGASMLFALGLILYGVWFLHKLTNVSFL